MTRYCLNASVTMVAWIYVVADTPDEALEEAEQADRSQWEWDEGTAEFEFNITPQYEVLT